jgi:hypothetical protein
MGGGEFWWWSVLLAAGYGATMYRRTSFYQAVELWRSKILSISTVSTGLSRQNHLVSRGS